MEDIDLAEHWNETFSQLCCYIRKKNQLHKAELFIRIWWVWHLTTIKLTTLE